MATTTTATDSVIVRFLLPFDYPGPQATPQPLRMRSSKSKRTSPLKGVHDKCRLPFRINHENQLPSRMLNALRTYLETAKPMDPTEISAIWASYQRFERKYATNGCEADLSLFSYELAKVARDCADLLKSPQTAAWLRDYSTRDGIVTTDNAVLWSSAVEDEGPAVLVEDKSIPVMDEHLPALLNMRSNLFRSTAQSNWECAASIVAKLSWQATDGDRYCKWGVLFSGQQFLIYHIMRVRVDTEMRDTCVMTYSDAIAINDTQSPYISLLVYMILSSDESQTSLAAALGLTPPEQAQIVEDHVGTNSEARFGAFMTQGSVDHAMTSSLLRTQNISLRFEPDKSEIILYTRISSSRKSSTLPYEPDTADGTRHSRCEGYGAVGIVYRAAEGCIVKLERSPGNAEDLIHEANIYQVLSSCNGVCFLPTFFGLFRHGTSVALVLSDEGVPVADFGELSLNDRKLLYMLLANMHAHGVLHGDFRPANVLHGPRGPVLIDFSHSDVGHVCPHGSPCWELNDAQSRLKLKDNELHNKWTWFMYKWRILRRSLRTWSPLGRDHNITGMSCVLLVAAAIFSLIRRLNTTFTLNGR